MEGKEKFLVTVFFFIHARWAAFSLKRRSSRSESFVSFSLALPSSNLLK